MLLWPFNKYPGTDYETFNWEWLLRVGKRMERVINDLFSDTGALHQMVDKVLGEHPEWVTTVMDSAITAAKIQPAFLKQILNVWATPEEFGAAGDGITDDSGAIQDAIDSGRPVLMYPGTTYLAASAITIPSGTTINGLSATIDFSNNDNGFFVESGSENIIVKNLNTVLHYTPGSRLPTIVHYGIEGSGNNEYYSHDIILENISMTGGVMGISANSAKNLIIKNVKTSGMIYRPEVSAGGYGILLQSCVDVDIENYDGMIGNYGRHDIYISVDQTKTANKPCKNINVNGFKADHSDMSLIGTSFYSTNTTPIMVRHSQNVNINNSIGVKTAGLVTCNLEDGNIEALKINDAVLNDPVYVSGANETRSMFNILYDATYKSNMDINNAVVINKTDSSYTQFASLASGTFYLNNIEMEETELLIYNSVRYGLYNSRRSGNSYDIRFSGTDTVRGKVRNFYNSTRDSDQALYIIENTATLADGMFDNSYMYYRPTVTVPGSLTNYTIEYQDAELMGSLIVLHFRINCITPNGSGETVITLPDYKFRSPQYIQAGSGVLYTPPNTGNINVYNMNANETANIHFATFVDRH